MRSVSVLGPFAGAFTVLSMFAPFGSTASFAQTVNTNEIIIAQAGQEKKGGAEGAAESPRRSPGAGAPRSGTNRDGGATGGTGGGRPMAAPDAIKVPQNVAPRSGDARAGGVPRGDRADRGISRERNRSDGGVISGSGRNDAGQVRSGRSGRAEVIVRGGGSANRPWRGGRRLNWGPGGRFYFWNGNYYGDCRWLLRRAEATGSRYWMSRYRQCRADY